MLNFDWLNNLRSGRTLKSARRRSRQRSRGNSTNIQALQIRTMLSGDPIASMATTNDHDEADDETESDDEAGDEGEGQNLATLLEQLRGLSDDDVTALVEDLNLDDAEERQEITDFLDELRELSDAELSEALGEISEE